jgi:Fe2+ transport system protein B
LLCSDSLILVNRRFLTTLQGFISAWATGPEKRWNRPKVLRFDGVTYKVVDLPGSYGLSANSEEEVVTRDYIQSGKADLVCILVDASQLERSLYMLADFVGVRMPVMLVLNMMDVAEAAGKKIDAAAIEKLLGIPVLGFSAAETKRYPEFFKKCSAIKTSCLP